MAFLPSLHAPLPAAASRAPTDPAILELARTGVLPDRDFVLRFFPVFDFQRGVVAALFCTPMYARAGAEAIYGHQALHGLAPGEGAAVDCAILEHALTFAGRLRRHGVVAAVGASVSFATLCDPSGRVAYREALRTAHARDESYLVIKIEAIPETTGGQRIGEIVSCVRALAPRVFVHLPGSHVPLGGHEPLHAAGLVLSMPARLPQHGMQTEARWLVRTAALQSALACMDHIGSDGELEITRAAGVRFVAGHALGRPALAAAAPLQDIREQLYGAAEAPARAFR